MTVPAASLMGSSVRPRCGVAHALVRAATALVPTPGALSRMRREESRRGTHSCVPPRHHCYTQIATDNDPCFLICVDLCSSVASLSLFIRGHMSAVGQLVVTAGEVEQRFAFADNGSHHFAHDQIVVAGGEALPDGAFDFR